VIYQPAASALHSVKPQVGVLYCASIGLLALSTRNPVVVLTALALVLLSARLAGVTKTVLRAAKYFLPVALLITVLNPIFVQEGETILIRGFNMPVLGQVDITLEAVIYGGLDAIRALIVVLAFALYSACVDPDELLRLMRRFAFRSSLTATLATRMVPLLRTDAERFAEAQKTLVGHRQSRVATVRATVENALERSFSIASTLELRGYSLDKKSSIEKRSKSRHDINFLLAAAFCITLALLSLVGVSGGFSAYPYIEFSVTRYELVPAFVTLLAALYAGASKLGVGVRSG